LLLQRNNLIIFAMQQFFLLVTGADENYADVSLEKKKFLFIPVERNSSQSFLISVKRLFSS